MDTPQPTSLDRAIAPYLKRRRAFIDPARFARDCSDFPATRIVDFLNMLAESGRIKRVWRLEAPDGVLIGPAFDSPLDVPDVMPDRFYEVYHKVDDCTLIAGFEVT